MAKKAVDPIIAKYEELGELFNKSATDIEVTNLFISLDELSRDLLAKAVRVDVNPSIAGKEYFRFEIDNQFSRPINKALYDAGINKKTYITETGDEIELTPVDFFWEQIKKQSITNQNANDITSAVYVIAMHTCATIDILKGGGGRKTAGTFFERLVGHIYARHFNIEPDRETLSVEFDGERIKIPIDFAFNVGPKKPRYHVPAKTSTRDRAVQVWAQQKVLDGAYGTGRYLCLLTSMCEIEYKPKTNTVSEVCVPEQWKNYQLFIAQIKRAYYLDIPQKYADLKDDFPSINVKSFGEFFHESSML